MEPKELSTLTDEELLQEAKKMKSNNTIKAVLIGVLLGIIFYSIVKKTVGLLTIIPFYFLFKLSSNSKKNEELERLLKERKLK